MGSNNREVLMRYIKFFFVAIATMTVAACSVSFKTDVTAFHQLPEPSGEKVSIVPIDLKKVGSLEFQSYAALVGQELMKLGYIPAENGEPDLIVGLDYSKNDGRERLTTQPGFRNDFYWNNWRGFGYWHTFDPLWGPGSFNDDIRATTVFRTMLNLEIRDPKGGKLYEGRVETENSESSMPVVVPQLVKALFKTFPGESGKTIRVITEADKETD